MKIMKENKVLTSEALNAEMVLNERIRQANENKREEQYEEMVDATAESISATQESKEATEHSIEITTIVETKLDNGEFNGVSGVWVGDETPIGDDYNVWVDPSSVDGNFATVATTGSYKDLVDTPISLPADGGNADTLSGIGIDDIVQLEQIANRLDIVEDGYVLDGRQGKVLDDKIGNVSKIETLSATDTLADLLDIVEEGKTRKFQYETDALPSDYPDTMISSGHVFRPLVTANRVTSGLMYLEITSPNSATGSPKTTTGYYNGRFYWNTSVTKDDIVNNLMTTREGFVADARTVKTINDKVEANTRSISDVNNKLPLTNKKVIVLGDSISRGMLSASVASDRPWTSTFAMKTGATVTNPSIAGATLAGVSSIGLTTTIQTIDFTQYDIVIMPIGLNDYYNNVPLTDSANSVLSFLGAWEYCIERILTQKPSMQIILGTMPYVEYMDIPRPNTKLLYRDYMKATLETARKYGLTVIDFCYGMGLNSKNLNDMTWDTLHPTQTMYDKMGEYAAQAFPGQTYNQNHESWIQIGASASTTGEAITTTFDVANYREIYICITNGSGELLSSTVCPIALVNSLSTIYTVYANSSSWGKAVFSTDKRTVTLTQFNAAYMFMFAR